ncbi:MAG: hypothetical protein AABX48_01675 [Nanoarchaeota archaeon]
MTWIKNLVIGIAILILTVAVGVYGISTLYGKAPTYEKYCPNLINQTVCESNGGDWIDNTQLVTDAQGSTKPVPIGGGYCQYDSTPCQKNYDDANRAYQRNVFFIALPLGVIIIALGAVIFGLESVGGGLMAGGVGIILYGIQGFWQYADDWLKFALSLVGLVVVIWLAYWFNKKFKK